MPNNMLVKRYITFQKFKKKHNIPRVNFFKKPLDKVMLEYGYKKMEEIKLENYTAMDILKEWNKDKNYYNIVYYVAYLIRTNEFILKIFAKDFHHIVDGEIIN